MIFLPVVILALVQGITEFLPISSSGHLVLFHYLLEDGSHLSDKQQKTLDVAVHAGTLLAVLLYFRSDFWALIKGGLQLLCFNVKTVEAQKSFHVIIASIPVIVAGFLLFQFDFSLFDSLVIMAWMTLIFGIVLFFADRRPQNSQAVETFTWKQALIYGFAQCLALIPGVSRSGITMTAGRFLGHSRVEAARFSMLLGMVAISGAGVLTGLSLLSDMEIKSDFLALLGVGVVVSFLSAYIAILWMMRWIKSSSFTPFVIYRVILGIVLLGLLYGGIIPHDVSL